MSCVDRFSSKSRAYRPNAAEVARGPFIGARLALSGNLPHPDCHRGDRTTALPEVIGKPNSPDDLKRLQRRHDDGHSFVDELLDIPQPLGLVPCYMTRLCREYRGSDDDQAATLALNDSRPPTLVDHGGEQFNRTAGPLGVFFFRVVCRWPVSTRRTAIPNAFFVPTRTTSFLPRVIAVYSRFLWSIR